MMNRKIFLIMLLILTLSLIVVFGGCNDDIPTNEPPADNPPGDNPPTTYTITWKNYDGAILKIEENVAKDSIPTFNGTMPTRPTNGAIYYQFSGWTPALQNVTENATYTATFTEIDTSNVAGSTPILSQDGKTIQYGLYPQKRVSDATLIAKLNNLQPTVINGWYWCENKFYAKHTAKVFNNESYKFDDNTAIVNGTSYWFECQPIIWNVLQSNNGYTLFSSKILDVGNFYSSYANRAIDGNTVYANNYQHSDIRNWLNSEFFNTAFALNNSPIKQVEVSNSSETTDVNTNSYVCANTQDKVYLPSYKDLTNATYGFDTDFTAKSVTRQAKTTDFARANGVWANLKTDTDANSLYNGIYWTRSPSSQYNYTAWVANSGGYLSQYAIDGASHGIRPCITIANA